MPQPVWWTTTFVGWKTSLLVGTAAAGVLAGLILCEIFILTLPILLYAPQAVAMRTLGLLFVSIKAEESLRLTEIFSRGAKQSIKVVCISGKHLFRTKGSPLHEKALAGQLEVIMPRSDKTNPTVENRYATYPEQYKFAEHISTMDEYVEQIDAAKRFLLNFNNTVHEHDGLCPWRIVVIDDRCLVQSYFPNKQGNESHQAPAFVFRRVGEVDHVHTYHECFEQTYDLLKTTAKHITKSPPSPKKTATRKSQKKPNSAVAHVDENSSNKAIDSDKK